MGTFLINGAKTEAKRKIQTDTGRVVEREDFEGGVYRRLKSGGDA